MSDIPVGSPPAPPGRHAAPGGWYPDPVDAARERYWDGWQWSRNTRPRAATQPAGGPPGFVGAGLRGPASGAPAGSTQAVATADGVPLASWWARAAAAVVDNILTSTLVLALALPIWRSLYAAMRDYVRAVVVAQQTGGTPPPLGPTDLVSASDQLVLTALTLGVSMVYHVAFLRWRGATPGKLLLRLRVVPVDRGRFTGQLSWNTVGLRAAVWVMPGLNSLLAVVSLFDALFPLWHPRRQALHDLAARTQVVRRSD